MDDMAASEFNNWLIDVAFGATIAGVKSYLTGDGFWAGVADYLVDEMVDYVRGAIVSWAEEHADDGGFTGALASAIIWLDDAISWFTGKKKDEEEDGDDADYVSGETDDCFTKVEVPDGPGDYGNPTDDLPSPFPFPWPDSDSENEDDYKDIVCGVNPNLIAQRQIALDTMASMLLYQAQATKY